MTRLPTIILLLSLVAACGPAPDPTPLIDRALATIDPDGKLAGTIYLRQEGEFEPSGGASVKVPYVSETLLVLPDRMVTRASVAGVTTVKCVGGGKAWIRTGAAVADLTGPAAAEERADTDDLLALLVRPLTTGAFKLSRSGEAVEITSPGGTERTVEFDPAGSLPSRLVREARNSRGGTASLVREFSDWKAFGAIRFPSTVVVSMGGSRLELVTKTIEFDPADTRGLSTRRPRDRGEFRTGPIRRVPEPGGNYLLVRTQGTYLDLAKGDALLRNGCRQVFATALGPIRRVFLALPGKDGVSVVTSMIPVRFERVEETRRLPQGVEMARLTETETLAMKLTGPYPRDRSLEQTLVNYGRDLGLEAAGPARYLILSGPARYLILSDPDLGDPADLSMEIRMPVRPRPEREPK